MAKRQKIAAGWEGSISAKIPCTTGLLDLEPVPDGKLKAAGLHFVLKPQLAASSSGLINLMAFTEEQFGACKGKLAGRSTANLGELQKLVTVAELVPTNFELFAMSLRCGRCRADLWTAPPFQPAILKLPFVINFTVKRNSACPCKPLLHATVFEARLSPAVAAPAVPAYLSSLHGGLLSDVTLRVGGRGKQGGYKELRAHRLILSAASEVFRAMLQDGRFAEGVSGVVHIDDVPVEVMEAALRHCYGQELGQLSGGELVELLALAERYQLLELKDVCVDLLSCDTSLDALQLLALAETNQAPALKASVMARIVSSPDRDAILNRDSAKQMMVSRPEAFLELVMALNKKVGS